MTIYLWAANLVKGATQRERTACLRWDLNPGQSSVYWWQALFHHQAIHKWCWEIIGKGMKKQPYTLPNQITYTAFTSMHDLLPSVNETFLRYKEIVYSSQCMLNREFACQDKLYYLRFNAANGLSCFAFTKLSAVWQLMTYFTMTHRPFPFLWFERQK